jgi:GNAT superfamily N-acetyltransferase
MKIKEAPKELLPEIYNFIKNQTQHFKKPLSVFLEDETKSGSIKRLVAFHDDEIVGYISFKDHLFSPNKLKFFKFWVSDEVDKAEIVNGFFDFYGFNFSQPLLSTGIFEDETWKINFLLENGFKEIGRMWRSFMNPQDYTSKIINKCSVETITVEEFFKRDVNAFEKFFNLDRLLVDLIPADFPMEKMSLEKFKSIIAQSHLDQRLSYFAISQNQLIGMSTTAFVEGKAHVMLTGVLEEFQKRGVAFKLKELAILACKERGITHLSTMNDSVNIPMLNLNSKFGFKKEISVLRLDKSV